MLQETKKAKHTIDGMERYVRNQHGTDEETVNELLKQLDELRKSIPE